MSIRLYATRHTAVASSASHTGRSIAHLNKFPECHELCRRVDLPIKHFIAHVAPQAYELGSNLAKLFTGLALPELVMKAIENRMAAHDFKDRQMILQAAGVVPSPHGATIHVNQNNAQWNSGNSRLPDFSQDVIELVAAIRDW